MKMLNNRTGSPTRVRWVSGSSVADVQSRRMDGWEKAGGPWAGPVWWRTWVVERKKFLLAGSEERKLRRGVEMGLGRHQYKVRSTLSFHPHFISPWRTIFCCPAVMQVTVTGDPRCLHSTRPELEFLSIWSSGSDVLVNVYQPALQGSKGLLQSVCWFSRCKYSHRGFSQAPRWHPWMPSWNERHAVKFSRC